RIVDNLLRPLHDAERDMDAIEDLVPMRHRLCAEDFVEDDAKLRHVREELRRIGEARVGQEVGATDRFGYGRQLVRRDDEHEPGAIGGLVYVQRRIGWILAVVRREKLRVTQRRLDRDARRPDALGEQRGRYIRSLAGALATIERRDDRR